MDISQQVPVTLPAFEWYLLLGWIAAHEKGQPINVPDKIAKQLQEAAKP
jgi:hypothetical protein